MEINEIPKGQLPTIILTTLLTGDKYGYEIISEVETKTNGELKIKKPSLYSSLSRMENQDLVSSYWKDSEIGGRRHYYRLTDYGRKQVLQWQEDLLLSQTNVTKMLDKASQNTSIVNEVDSGAQNVKKDVFAQQENLFDALNSIDNSSNDKAMADKSNDFVIEKNDVFLQYDLFDKNLISTPADSTTLNQKPYVFNMSALDGSQQKERLEENLNKQEQPSECKSISIEEILNSRFEDKIDNSKQTSNAVKIDMGNFDIENELNSYKKDLTSYFDNAKKLDTNSPSPFDFAQHNSFPSFEADSNAELVADNTAQNANETLSDAKPQEDIPLKKDDAVFITDELDENAFKVKKIEPAIFNTLPPKSEERSADFQQPTHPSQSIQSTTETYYENYYELKRYYSKKDINLKIYNDTTQLPNSFLPEIKVNKFKFVCYLIFFALSMIELISCYIILKANSLISSNYLYYYLSAFVVLLIPQLYFTFKFISNPNKSTPKKSITLNPFWFKFCFIILAAAIVCSVNMLFGMTFANIKYYLSTLVLPIVILCNALILHIIKAKILQKTHKEN